MKKVIVCTPKNDPNLVNPKKKNRQWMVINYFLINYRPTFHNEKDPIL